MLSIEQSKERIDISISEEATIYQVGEYAEQIMPMLHAAPPVHVDLGQVTAIDSSVTQLLMFLKQVRMGEGLATVMHNHSEEVVDVFGKLGVAKWFDDPILIQSKARN